ncbi:aspartic-type signal peptidase [Fusarium albosuccineum]|uniref:Aspartic-type signal peptidase n=1 Tax=Fusarium albosuccineum TaxID=1237068 RepID=A0A8H4PF42_9HYPO|nr:aspartic-type signal peptidase [Fusarium albosuccineum]
MLSALLLAALPALARASSSYDDTTTDGVIRFPLKVSTGAPVVKGVTKRQHDVALQSQQTGFFYSIELEMGTPGQKVSVNLDTGSAELWVNPVCSKAQNPAFCKTFGHFGESSTFTDLNTTGGVVYGTGYAYYNYGYDYVSVGSAKIKNQVFGVAYDTSFTSVGIMGAAPDLNGWNAPYPLVIDSMAKQGLIKSRVLSLDIRTMDSERGAVIYGGIDTSKFSGPLEKRPIVPADASPDGLTRYWVYLDGISLIQEDGSKDPVFSKTNGQIVLLDSGYTISALPGPIFEKIVAAFPTAKKGSGAYYDVDCSVADVKGTVDFTFGKTVIKVPYADFIWHNDGKCVLGVFQDDEFPVLGDTFLRAAYVVYDWDNKNVWLANNEDCGSKLVSVGSGPDAVPQLTGDCPASDSTATSTSEVSTSTESETESVTSAETTTTSDVQADPVTTDSETTTFSTTRFSNSSVTTAKSLAANTYSAPTGSITLTSTYTTTDVYTITACPETVTDCPVGKVTTEVITSTTTWCPGKSGNEQAPRPTTAPAETATRVYTITDCPGSGACNKGEVTTEVYAVTQPAVGIETNAVYTIPEAIHCGAGNHGCKEATTKALHVVTITPPVKAPHPTPVPGHCTTCGRPGGSSNGTVTGIYTHPAKPTQVYTQPGEGTQVYTQPGATYTQPGQSYPQPPASTVATVVKPSGSGGYGETPEPTGTSPAVVTAAAAWNAPGMFAVAVGALIAAAL